MTLKRMEAYTSAESGGWVVWAWVTDPADGIRRSRRVVKLAVQSDAFEVRDLLERDGIPESRVNALIRGYDGEPRVIARRGASSGPAFARRHEEERHDKKE